VEERLDLAEAALLAIDPLKQKDDQEVASADAECEKIVSSIKVVLPPEKRVGRRVKEVRRKLLGKCK
jgi:hypothetical protein